jgi:hypothetical protein
MITLIQQTKDGSQFLSYNGKKLSANREGIILFMEDWNQIDELEKAGLVTHKFYKHLYGHTEYIIK